MLCSKQFSFSPLLILIIVQVFLQKIKVKSFPPGNMLASVVETTNLCIPLLFIVVYWLETFENQNPNMYLTFSVTDVRMCLKITTPPNY